MTFSEKRRMIISCLSGNVLEWFDFAVYGFVAHIISKQFFPTDSGFLSIILTYSVFAVGFLARPLGSIVFGHIGDAIGRQKALVLSNFVMAVPTVCIGLLPTYESIGVFAPILLLICRIFQGASIGGEFSGSFVYLVEQAPPGKKGIFGCWADIGCHLGMILGSLVVAFLSQTMSEEAFQSFGWRIPFICGVFLAALGVYMRRTLPESKEFVKPERAPLKNLFQNHVKRVLMAALMISLNAIGYYTISVFLPNQTIFLGKFPAHKAFYFSTAVMITLTAGNILSAYLADRMDKIKIYSFGALSSAVFAFPVFYALTYLALPTQIIITCLFAFFLGFCFGPRPPLLAEIFSKDVRFTGVAITMSLSMGLVGGTTPLIATSIVQYTGSPLWPFILVMVASLATLYALRHVQNMLTEQPKADLKKVA